MSQQIKMLNEDNVRTILKWINLSASIDKSIDDLNIRTDAVFSSKKVSELAQEVKHSLEQYIQSSINGLTHLKKKIVDTLPSDADAEENILYLVKDTSVVDDVVYNQYLLIDGVLEPLGSTNTDLSNYYSKDESDAKFALLSNLQTLIDMVGNASDLETTAKDTLVNAINEIKEGLDNCITKDAIVTTLGDTVTDEQVPSAKVVYDNFKKRRLNSYTYLSEIYLTPPCTTQDIFLALPNMSTIVIACGDKTTSITDVPENYGFLQITKHSQGRFNIEYNLSAENSIAKNRKWIGQLKGSDGSGVKWDEIFYTTTVTCNNAVVIEDYLDLLDQDANCDILFTNNGNTGEIVDLTRQKLFCIEHRKRNNAQMYTQVAYYPAIGIIAQRSKDWWSDAWSPWRKIYSTSVPDVPVTNIVSEIPDITINNTATYEVRNGICYVNIWGIKSTSETSGLVLKQDMPKASQMTMGIIYSGNISQPSGTVWIPNDTTKLYIKIGIQSTGVNVSFSYPVKE